MTTTGDKRERRKLARERLHRLQERAKQRELASQMTTASAAPAVALDAAPVSPLKAIRDADASVAEKQKQRQEAIDTLERDVADLGRLAEPTSTTADDILRIRKEVDALKRDFYANLASWQKVQLARHPQRPYTDDFIRLLFEDFSEIHGDRSFADDAALIAGMARFHGKPCLVIGTQKGRGTKQRVERNFGQARPEGYRKALRAMRLAAKFNRPIFVFVDTPGAYPGVDAEERGQAEAIARNIREMARLATPIIVTVTGEGGSGGALAIAVGDRVFMLENSIYSVISPEGCASIMWRDSTKAELAAEALKITAPDLLKLKLVDAVIPEPEGGAHNDYEATAKLLDPVLLRALDELTLLSPQQLIDRRYDKFRAMGQFFA
ncbi:MAG: acetyl-CoA carboxylase carboxyltransferase subunit alpha [Candidatus Acidiferrales bacterium]